MDVNSLPTHYIFVATVNVDFTQYAGSSDLQRIALYLRQQDLNDNRHFSRRFIDRVESCHLVPIEEAKPFPPSITPTYP